MKETLSYHMDHGAKTAAYVDAFMQAINWTNVRRSYDERLSRDLRSGSIKRLR
jgi:superoxide dismutase, Fe-Mn family